MIPKGSGSENNSFLKMAMPADGDRCDQDLRRRLRARRPAAGPARRPSSASASAARPTCACALAKRAATRPLGTAAPIRKGRAARSAAVGRGQSARRRSAGAGRRRDRVRRARRTGRDPHHHEPGGGQHAVPFGAPRQRDDHADGVATASRRGTKPMSRHAALRRSPATSDRGGLPGGPGCTGAIDASCRATSLAHLSRHRCAQVRALRIDDTVTLQGTLFGIRDATPDRAVRPRSHDPLRSCRPRRDPHRAQRAQGARPAPSIPPATRRCASAPRPRRAWSASRGRCCAAAACG